MIMFRKGKVTVQAGYLSSPMMVEWGEGSEQKKGLSTGVQDNICSALIL